MFQSLNYVRAGFTAAEAVAAGGNGGTSAGIAVSTFINALTPSSFGGYSSFNYQASSSASSSAADGGFVLYPNKSNTNQMKSVYTK